MTRNKKNKKKILIHPYSKESLQMKEIQLKVLIAMLEALLLLPIASKIIEHKNIGENNIVISLLSYTLLFIFFYLVNLRNKKYKFREWEFLDDEVQLISDKKLDGEISNLLVTKYVVLIAINVALIIPISLTFSTIIASIITFIISVVMKDVLITELIKFLLIALIFKVFLTSINSFFVENIRDKEELF